MSTGQKTPDDRRQAAVDDYTATREPYAVVAARHGISRSVLHAWVNPRPDWKRGPKRWPVEEIALTGGRWVNVRGVMRWEAFEPIDKRDLTDRERRHEWEEDMFTEDEARDAHARFAAGQRGQRVELGERVYNRRKKRAQVARKRAA